MFRRQIPSPNGNHPHCRVPSPKFAAVVRGRPGATALGVALTIAICAPSSGHAKTSIADQTASGLIQCPPVKEAGPSTLPQAKIHLHAASGLARLYGGAPISVSTFHYDNSRTGWNPNETDLTPASVASSSFGLLKAIPIKGAAMGQPLIESGYLMPDGSVHDLLIVATTQNIVYAFDAQSYTQLWSVSLGPPITDQRPNCSRQPVVGVASTPVIGPGATTGQLILYLVGNLQPAPGVYQTQVRALDLGSGQDVRPATYLNASVTLPSGPVISYDPAHQFNRAGLALNNGNLYIGIASSCNEGDFQNIGFLFKVSTDFTSQTAFSTISWQKGSKMLSDIWMSGFAPAIDSAGNVYVTTGNGNATLRPPRDWGSSVIKFAPDLSTVVDSFTPANYPILAQHDWDFSSGGVMLIPPTPGQNVDPMAVAMGKDPTIYLLDQFHLGGYSRTNQGALQALVVGPALGDGVWGGPAYYSGPAGPTIFYQTQGDFLKAYQLSAGAPPSLSLVAQGATLSSNGGSSPVVSSNGSAPNTGVVWLVRRTSPPALEAYDAGTLGAPIYQASIGANYSIYHTPVVANGRVYVGSVNSVYVFGLTDN